MIIDITDKCNLSCIYCCRGNNLNKDLDDPHNDELLDLIQQIIDMRGTFVVLQGGEPLLKPSVMELIKRMSSLKVIKPGYYLDSMRKIIKQKYSNEKFLINYKKTLIEQNLPLYYLSTNGMVYSDDIRDALYNSGFSIDVSLDSANEETNRKTRIGIDFHKVLKTISAFAEKLPVNISSTVTEYNVDELPDILSIAKKSGCISVIFSPVITVGRRKEGNMSWTEKYIDSLNLVLDRFEEDNMDSFYLNIKLYNHHLQSEKGQVLHERLLNTPNIFIEHHKCSAFDKVKELYIDTKMNVYGCASTKNCEELRIGNLRELKLKEIWNSQKRIDLKNVLSPYCLISDNFGGCTAGAYTYSKSIKK